MKSQTALVAAAALVVMSALAGYVANARDASADAHPARAAVARSPYSIAFTRSPCYGRCPTFSLQIDGDGRTRLAVDASTKNPSYTDTANPMLFDFALSPDQHAVLTAMIDNGGFRDLDRDYSAEVTDMPSATIAIESPEGRWSTHVYAVPCRREVVAGEPLPWKVEKYVPDIFCDLLDRLDAIACDAYRNGTPRDTNRLLQPLNPPECPNPQ
ncbi:MAG: DUF6438 domain-containing protein [Pseudomonadota bacterium]